MTREEAIKELKNIKENIFWGDEYGVCFRDEWVEAYEMAISALREQGKLATNLQPEANSCKWISVEDRLPDTYNNVLCYKDRNIRIGYYLGATYSKSVAAFRDLRSAFAFGVTHWMPLPEPPKEDGT